MNTNKTLLCVKFMYKTKFKLGKIIKKMREKI